MQENTLYSGANLRKLVEESGTKFIYICQQLGITYPTLHRWFNLPEVSKKNFDRVISVAKYIDYESEYHRVLEENKRLNLELMLLKSGTKAGQI